MRRREILTYGALAATWFATGSARSTEQNKEIKMIKTTLLYPNHDGAHFDFEYYENSHLPMVRTRLGSALKHISIDKGVAGGAPNAPAPFVVLANMQFNSMDEFQKAMAPHVEFIMKDVPNFTNIVPVPMISTSILDE
jgi:uncharacterized protein (TIGR02118 family)